MVSKLGKLHVLLYVVIYLSICLFIYLFMCLSIYFVEHVSFIHVFICIFIDIQGRIHVTMYISIWGFISFNFPTSFKATLRRLFK